jgi:hypothetical protein|tara:strand:- start:1755 stop:1904 length:150 start_codon:yes stop_codon:yes gene_type:complete
MNLLDLSLFEPYGTQTSAFKYLSMVFVVPFGKMTLPVIGFIDAAKSRLS